MLLYGNSHLHHESDGLLSVHVHHLHLAVGGALALTRLEE